MGLLGKIVENAENKIDEFGGTVTGKIFGGASGIKAGIGSMVNAAAQGLNAASAKGLGLNETQSAVRNGISSVIGKFGVVGKAVQFGAAAMDWLGSKTGHALTNIDKDQANLAGIKGASKAVGVLKSIPGLGLLLQGKKLTGGPEQEYSPVQLGQGRGSGVCVSWWQRPACSTDIRAHDTYWWQFALL